MSKGIITQIIIGPVVDVRFDEKLLPIKNALHVKHANGTLTLEAGSSISGSTVSAASRCKTPRGIATRSRSDRHRCAYLGTGRRSGARQNVQRDRRADRRHCRICRKTRDVCLSHQDPPPFSRQSTKAELFETGIKAIDLLAPFHQGKARSGSSAAPESARPCSSRNSFTMSHPSTAATPYSQESASACAKATTSITK